MCDYIIFYQEEDNTDSPLFVFLCELKSGNPGGAYKQAENGKLIADLILAMAQHHRPAKKPKRILYRGLIFGTRYKMVPKGRLTETTCTYNASSRRIPEMGFTYLPCGGKYPLRHFCI
jgi:hypothetical protein